MDEIPASEFDSRAFDAKELVLRYRKRVPLPQLQKSLRAHHATVRQELVELINEKYADFVSLSSRMQGVERALRPLRAPLEESSELTKSLHTKLGALLGQAEDSQKELARVRARKEALAAYIENAEILERAKEAAGQRWANPQESDDFLREHVAQENIARDLRRIRLNLGGRLRAPTAAAGGPLRAPPPPPPPPPPRAVPASAPQQPPPPPSEPQGGGGAGAEEEEVAPECQALLQEAAAFEAQFAARLHERLAALVAAARRGWEVQPPPPAPGQAGRQAPPEAEHAAGPEPGPPPRAELLAIAHLCRALATIGRSAEVEATFAEAFVKAALDAAAAACTSAAEDARRQALAGEPSPGGAPAAPSAALGLGAGAVDLGPFFDAVQARLLGDGAPLLWFARRLRGPAGGGGQGSESEAEGGGDAESALLAVHSLRLVSNAVATPVLQHVQQVWPNVFMPAFPDIFAANYAHAGRFISAVEAFMTPSERQAFSRSAALLDFRRRWKTQVYFSLRQKEAVQRLQASAAKPGLGQGGGFYLEASAELVRLLDLMWSDRWYMEALYPKVVQLSLELVAKYGRLAAAAADSPDVPGAGWDASAASPAWAPSSQPLRLARAAADVFKVLSALKLDGGEDEQGLPGRAVRLALKRLPAAGGAQPAGRRPEELVRALFQEADAATRPVLAELEDAMLKHVSAAVVPQFAAIRGIPALYRMLNKPVPTKPSPYVDSALRPIVALQEAAQAVAPPALVSSWLRRAREAAALEFASQAAQLLESTKQQEASLRRLGGRGPSGEAQVSDLDKIHIQLCLDVEVFASAAAGLGGAAEGCGGLAKLAEAVAPVRPTYEAHRAPPPS